MTPQMASRRKAEGRSIVPVEAGAVQDGPPGRFRSCLSAVLNLFDMMNQAQEGQVYAHLARRFGLTEAQARAAVEALLPAFSAALKRSTDDPAGLTNFLQTLSTGGFAPFFDAAGAAQSASAMQAGNGILGQLFGSPEVSRAIAAQAAAMTGVNAEILKQMMPVLAATIMGGLFRQTQTPAMQGIVEQMLRGMGMAAPPTGASAAPANPWEQLMRTMMSGWFGQGAGGAGQGAGTPPTGRDLFGEMFEAGQAAQRQGASTFDSLLDNFLNRMRRG